MGSHALNLHLFSHFCGWAVYSSAEANSSICENPVGANVTIYLESDHFSPPPQLPPLSKSHHHGLFQEPLFSLWFIPYHSEPILHTKDNMMLSKFNYSLAFLHQKATRGWPCRCKTPSLYYGHTVYDDLVLHRLSEIIFHHSPLIYSSSAAVASRLFLEHSWWIPALCLLFAHMYEWLTPSLWSDLYWKFTF